jgi:phosphoribosylaminoimidazole-succinocarboxamide synthase
MEHGFAGKEGQKMPYMPDEFVYTVSNRYIQLYELITGLQFEKAEVSQISDRIYKNVTNYLANNK